MPTSFFTKKSDIFLKKAESRKEFGDKKTDGVLFDDGAVSFLSY